MRRKKPTRKSNIGRPRAFDRERALEQALWLFWANGYEGTSIAGLTKALGIAPPSLYAAFGSKEELFKETIRVYGSRYGLDIAGAITKEPSAKATIARILREAATTFARRGMPPGCFIASGMLSTAIEHKPLSDHLAAKREAMMQAIKGCIQRSAAAGELDRSTDVDGLACFFAAVIAGMSVQARDGADRKALAKIGELALRAWP